MPKHSHSLAHLTNEELIDEVKTLAGQERVATVQLIASLGELDVRRLYLGEGFSSLFTYCTQCLHLSEHAAYSRIEAARAARRWPIVLDMLAGGSVTLTTVVLVGRHLTPENHLTVLDAAKHRSRREVEQQVAALRPLPPVPPSIRKLPAPSPDIQPAPVPLSAPQISVAPATSTPANVELARSAPGSFVHRALVGTTGRCVERGFLEFHHVVPFAKGGETTSANLQLRCRAHNLYEAKNAGLGSLRELQGATACERLFTLED